MTGDRVRVRGIYATALTERFRRGDLSVVQASAPIEDRFDAAFGDGPAAASVATTEDRQGVGVTGDPGTVAAATDPLTDVGRDALAWRDPTPREAVFAAEVVDTVGGGAVLDLGEREGYLPFDAVDGYVDVGDRFRVQVADPVAVWADHRPELRVELRVGGRVVSLVRGQSRPTADAGGDRATELARTAELLDPDPPEGWGIHFGRRAADAGMDALGTALADAADRARTVEAALADAGLAGEDPGIDGDDPGFEGDSGDGGDGLPREVAAPLSGRWVWFGRESRFSLDADRRAVAPTMRGHHRIKAGARSASGAVDFVEAVCDPPGGSGDGGDGAGGSGTDGGNGETGESAGGAAPGDGFPFGATAGQFGPAEGGRVRIDHGKPDGRLFSLGTAEVTNLDADGSVTLRRTMSGSGEYDGLGTPRERGDVAITRITEGRWWYPTVYEGEGGERKGTYVNVCTPVEVFPDAVRYVDLHVDVVRQPDGTVRRVDDDELDAAVEAGNVPPDLAAKAREVAGRLEGGL